MDSEYIFGTETADSSFESVNVNTATQVAAVPQAGSALDTPLLPHDAAQVVVAPGQSVVRIPVTPGEEIQLPFGPDVQFQARLGDGNLAIKVGDVTVILQGYQAGGDNPPVIHAADGTPIDIATILAETDPNIDIQTAAGPGGSNGGQGADNTGALFQQLGGEGGLNSFDSVGSQDDTSNPDGGPNADGGSLLRSRSEGDANLAPTVEDFTASTTEDQAVVGDLPGTDPDGNPLIYSLVGAPQVGLTVHPDGAWSFDPTGHYDYLAQDEATTVTFQYQANDGALNSNTGTVTITIEGLNDPASIQGADSGQVKEATDETVTGTVTVTDADHDQSLPEVADNQPSDKGYGTWSVHADGTWTYVLDSNNPVINALPEGVTKTDTFTIVSTDNTATYPVTITITGTNDTATITGKSTGNVTEDSFFQLVAGGKLTVTDPDSGESHMQADAGTSAHGAWAIGKGGTWGYALNEFDPAVHALQAGETTTDTFTVKSQDGSQTQDVTITIHGVNDQAIITGDKSGEVTEDSGATVTGTLNVFDLDHDQAHTQVKTDIASKYGTWSVTADGEWSYKLNDSDPDVNKLGTGGKLTDSFTVTSLDGTDTQTVKITINGHNDAPVAGDLTLAPLNEDTSGAVANVRDVTTDPETASSSLTYSVVGSLPDGVTLGTDGTVHIDYAGHYDYLAAGEQTNISFQYKAFDGQAYSNVATVNAVVTGTNDAPVIGGTSATSGSIAEAGDLPQIDEAGLGGGLGLSAALSAQLAGNSTAGDALTDLLTHPGDVNAAVTTLKTELGIDTATAIAVVWNYLDDVYVSAGPNQANVNQGFTLLGIAYAKYLKDDHGTPLVDVTAKFTADGADAGSDPDRQQSLHDNLLGNLGTAALQQRYGSDPALQAAMTLLVTGVDPDLLARPYYDGGEANGAAGTAAHQWDLDNGYVSSVTGTLVATDADHGTMLTWSANATAGSYGSFALDATSGEWTYKLDNSLPATQALAQGETGTETFTATVTDEHGATDTVTVTISVTGTNDAPVIVSSSSDLPQIVEAGAGGGLEPAAALSAEIAGNSTVGAALTDLLTHPGDVHAAVTTVATELHVDTATAIAVVWDYLDDIYVSAGPNQANVNQGFTLLGIEYAAYLNAGGLPLVEVTAKYTADGGDAGTDPDRLQSLHDNLLGNLGTAALQQRYGNDPALQAAMTLLVTNLDPDLLARPYYDGGEANGAAGAAAHQWDLDNGYLPTASGMLVATDVDHGAVLTWSANTTAGSYGSFAVDAASGVWSYHLDNNLPATQALAQGETGTETFTATVTDEHGATDSINVTVNVIGTNDAPVIDSNGGGVTAGVSIAETSTAATTVHATDPDLSDTVTYSIAGGADAALFGIDGVSGALTFKNAPDFENPQDAGKDNVYDVQVKATDNHGVADIQDISVTVTDVQEGPSAASDYIFTTNSGTFGIDDGWLLANDTGTGLKIDSVDSNGHGNFFDPAFSISPPIFFEPSPLERDGSTYIDLDTDNGIIDHVYLKSGDTTSFTYEAKDSASATAVGTVEVNYTAGTTIDRSGDTHNDIIVGNSANETLKGGSGDDVIVGDGGNDLIFGGAGKDTIFGGGGDDVVRYSDGDVVHGGGDSSFALTTRGDVLAFSNSIDLTDAKHDGAFDGIETVSLQNSDLGLSGTQSQVLVLNAADVNGMSDHSIDPDSIFLSQYGSERTIRIDMEAVDELYLSSTKDGGRWSDTGKNIGGYEIYVHDTATSGPVGNSEDAYVAVHAPTPGSVHVDQDPVP